MPQEFIECRLYYGGRSSLMITGNHVEHVEAKCAFSRRDLFKIVVTVDCEQESITFEAADQKVTSRLTGPIKAITHYGYGGANSDNLVTDIEVR